MDSINNIIIKLISFLPKVIIRPLAFNYVAGENLRNALYITKKLNSRGLKVTLDILGEHTDSVKESKEITDDYIDILNKIDSHYLDSNISVKPTHLGLDLGIDLFKENLKTLVNHKSQNFIRIDMESSTVTDYTISSWIETFKNNINSGIVIQAYLKRSMDDLKRIHDTYSDFNIRLCKGIYREDESIAFKKAEEINSNYLDITRYCFENGIYICLATHDQPLLEKLYKLIDECKPKSDKFEFQMLYGVPMEKFININKNKKFETRIYVPFGKDWHPYSLRRMKENPAILSYVIKNLFK